SFVEELQRGMHAEQGLMLQKQRRLPVSTNSNREKIIDTLAWNIAMICGFDKKPLTFTATGLDGIITPERTYEFKVFNHTVAGPADIYVVRKIRRPREPSADKLVIIFEDKCEEWTGSSHDYLARVFGECM